eukprot:SAG31_NODE_12684_length_924_cov_1.549091_1_plen_47_part_00
MFDANVLDDRLQMWQVTVVDCREEVVLYLVVETAGDVKRGRAPDPV